MNDFVRVWSPLFAWLFSTLAAAAVYFVRSEAKVMIGRAEAKTAARLDDHHDRLLRLEGSMDTLPTRQDFHDLAISNTEIIGEMKAIKVAMEGMHETVSATRASVQRVNDYLLDKAK